MIGGFRGSCTLPKLRRHPEINCLKKLSKYHSNFRLNGSWIFVNNLRALWPNENLMSFLSFSDSFRMLILFFIKECWLSWDSAKSNFDFIFGCRFLLTPNKIIAFCLQSMLNIQKSLIMFERGGYLLQQTKTSDVVASKFRNKSSM